MQVVSKTHVGLVRDNNEDALLVRAPFLFAVADGMGGYAAGEIASRETLKAFEAATHGLRHGEQEDARKILEDAFCRANEHVYKMAASNEKFSGMGTTLTALYLAEDFTAYCCHIGDSRLYLLRAGELTQITSDHTYVEDLKRQGKISDEEALVHPQRHVLLQALGVEESFTADSLKFFVEAGDRLLLCSDGLTDMLRAEEILEIICDASLEAAAENLLEKSLDNGGRDNVSLILIEVSAPEVACHE